MSLVEIIEAIPGLTGVASDIIFYVLIFWLFSRFLDKQQEESMLHNEQMDKHTQIIIGLTEKLGELSSSIHEGNEKTGDISDKIDEVSRKIERLDSDFQKDRNKHDSSDEG